MTGLRFSRLLLVGLILGALGWGANLWAHRNGFPAPILHPASLLTIAFIVVFTLSLGLKVLRWRNGNRDVPLDPIFAARILMLAQATVYVGAMLFGWHTGIFVDQLSLLTLRSTHGPLWTSLAMMGGGVVLIITGLVVERFCRIPPDDFNKGDKEPPKLSQEGEFA